MSGLEPPTISWFGDRCLRIQFGTENTPETRARVRSAWERLNAGAPSGSVRGTPAFTTILLCYESLPKRNPEEWILRAVTESLDARFTEPVRSFAIPVCYEPPFAPDLESVASHCGISTQEVIRRHSQASYEVAFIGFTPGFPYLVGLPPELATPRLPSPRTRVAPGSVGIAGDQTGMYPHATPGGWRLIGRTCVRLFDPSEPCPSLLSIGDRVRFVPITAREFGENPPHIQEPV